MPIYYEELLKIVAELCDERNITAAVTGSLKGGLITGISAVIGSLLFGPLGLAVGGAVGGATAAVTAKGNFKPVSQIIMEMPPNRKKQLYLRLKNAFQNFDVTDAAVLASLFFKSSVKDLAIREVVNYLQNNLSMEVKLI